MLSCEELKPTETVVDMERLLSVIQQRDFSTLSAAEPIEVTLQRCFPEIPPEMLSKIAQQTAQLLNAQQSIAKEQSQEFFYVKLSLAIAISVTALYFGGPLAATGAKAALTQIYTLLFGVPQSGCLAYHLLLLPCQKHAEALALAYGPYVMGLTAGPATYSGLSLIEYLGQTIHGLRKWAFASGSSMLDVAPSYSASSIDEILAEFEELTVSERKVDENSDDDFVFICPHFQAYQQQQNTEAPFDMIPYATQSLKPK